jgi:hypothetical protein
MKTLRTIQTALAHAIADADRFGPRDALKASRRIRRYRAEQAERDTPRRGTAGSSRRAALERAAESDWRDQIAA